MGQWKMLAPGCKIVDVDRKLSNPKMFTCVRCGIQAEALPTGTTDIMGGTHFVYTTPVGWWSITTPYEMKLYCPAESVSIVGGEVLESDYRAETEGA